jgi:CheY-like chemotaxis protein
MEKLALAGRSILVVEDEPIVALDLEAQLSAAGAKVYSAAYLREALHLAEHPALSAAVLDLRLGGDDSMAVARRLTHLGIPFVFYSGYDLAQAAQRWPDAPVVSKPADDRLLVKTVAGLLH